jgi:hypothetical protein
MRIVLRIAILAVLAAACRKKADAPPPPPLQGVEMVRYGAMPHQTLRYQLTKGMKTAVEMEIDTDVSAPTFQRTMPTTVTVMELGADEVLPDGNAKVRTTILRASARERAGAQTSVEAANAQGMMLSGVEITGTLTPRGKILEPRLAGGANLPPGAAEGLSELVARSEEVAMPLPEPGVGVGAIGRVRRDATQLGIKMETITEIEVTAIEDQRVTYALRTEVKGADQHATIEGVDVAVTNVHGNGSGKGVIDLGRMAIFGEQSLELGFDLAAMKESGSVKMRTVKRLKPAAATATAEPPAPTPEPKPSAPPPEKAPPDPGAH